LRKIGEVGKRNYLSMTYSLCNNSTINYNPTLTVQSLSIISYRRRCSHKDFLRHSVYLRLFVRVKISCFPNWVRTRRTYTLSVVRHCVVFVRTHISAQIVLLIQSVTMGTEML